MARYTKLQIQEATDKLLEILKPGQVVTTVLRHCSRSRMSRSISVAIVEPDYEGVPSIRDITWLVGRALELPIDQNNGGVKVSGCGMDMGFHLVYSLGQRLWPNGTPEPHGRRNGEADSAGGYALKQRWL
jgi:hypothetical protein